MEQDSETRPGYIEHAANSENAPKISAYHALEGVHDFNRVPFAPPGGRWTIFNPPENRGSWEPRAIDAWYVGPAYNHYRCWVFWIPATGGYRISGN